MSRAPKTPAKPAAKIAKPAKPEGRRLNIGAVRSTFAPWNDPDATPLVRFESVSKRFGEQIAVNDVSLDIYPGEFFALLGPSGCGKTTLMRMLAGFESTDSGRITLAGEDLSGQPPHRRPVNMMFQSYALFPHLNVEQNIAFGLKQEGMPKADIAARVAEMLDLVKLQGFAKRKPDQLSGGQKQRVALARAVARKPRMLLLDEPLGALDKKLREETQFELMDLQIELGVTFLIVTHDQEEAMVMADRIAVMREGRIVQIGRPEEVYETPNSRYVAEFLGDVNLFEAKVDAIEQPMAHLNAPESHAGFYVLDDDCPGPGATVWLAVRPEKMRISLDPPPAGAKNVLAGEIWDIGYTGDWTNYIVELPGERLVRVARANSQRFVERPIGWDDKVWVSFDPDAGVVLEE
ncbi:ABC transporter ATP-binding protein [Caulobacter mirabilis]|uniref:Spermidine/putrescine import ATP-binding protein PotA n=1 Tax=Caulobacter mirabilis TaxID=69666 RepID=A0A2D2AX17_9CAUL|nr:ABC transporter ATP-binding protein [Caulobacter mirabilis]ATQ42533.1 polyamine ABC transporter ATP-binding protein [Caulobacter mirabilis]